MSKYVKNLIEDELKNRFDGVGEALLVNVIGMNANAAVELRRELREKDIRLLVVKNSLARRAAEGTPLAAAFQTAEGSLAVVWGGEDVVSLAKEVARLAAKKEYEPFAPRGGVMDGEPLTSEDVLRISAWPNRSEQLSLLVGQILGPGRTLVGQLQGPGAQLASQIKKKGEE